MKLIRVLPNTMRLKQLIKEHGDIWRIIDGPRPMQCFGGGIGVLARSLSGLHTRNLKPGDFTHESN